MMKRVVICVVAGLVLGASACSGSNDGSQRTQKTPVADATLSPTPRPEPTATPSPVPTSSPTPAPPTPTPTSSPALEPTATLAPTPTSSPTPEPTAGSTPQSEAAVAFENIESLAVEAYVEMSDMLTESDGPVSAHVTGWVALEEGQIFMQIDLSLPVDRSIEIVLSNSFDVHLRDVGTGDWYVIPENSETDTGPLEDIIGLVFVVEAFANLPAYPEDEAVELVSVQGGYEFKAVEPWGSTTAFYDEEYLLKDFVLKGPDGQDVVRANLSGHNEQFSMMSPVKGEPLPEDYWDAP